MSSTFELNLECCMEHLKELGSGQIVQTGSINSGTAKLSIYKLESTDIAHQESAHKLLDGD